MILVNSYGNESGGSFRAERLQTSSIALHGKTLLRSLRGTTSEYYIQLGVRSSSGHLGVLFLCRKWASKESIAKAIVQGWEK
jgi:phosphopantetheinyl transferase (holo-ACP synthase)